MRNFYDLTIDHNAENDHEVRRITKHGGKIVTELSNITLSEVKKIVPGEMTVSRSLGDYYVKTNHPHIILSTPEISSFYLNSKDDFIFLGSDGVFSVIDSKEFSLLSIASALEKFRELQEKDFFAKMEKEKEKSSLQDDKSIILGGSYQKTINHMLKAFEIDLLNGILKSSFLFGSSDNSSGILVCLDNLRRLFFENTLEYFQELFIKTSATNRVFRLRNQNIISFVPTSRVVFTKGDEDDEQQNKQKQTNNE